MNGFKNYQGRVGIDDMIFRYIVRVGKAKNGMIFYDINLEVDGKVPRANRTSLIKSSTSKNRISQEANPVNTDSMQKSDKNSEKKSERDLGIRHSERDYSYETLVSKPDMKLTMLKGNVPKNRADVVSEAKKNAAKVGDFNPKDSSVSVHVDDIDRDVVIGKKGLVHGLDRRFLENAQVTLYAGEILKHSIRINELTPTKQEATESYILIGAAIDKDGKLNIVRSVINQFSNELMSMEVLYAINTKKESTAALNAPLDSTPDYRTTISISDLLNYVNKFFPDA